MNKFCVFILHTAASWLPDSAWWILTSYHISKSAIETSEPLSCPFDVMRQSHKLSFLISFSFFTCCLLCFIHCWYCLQHIHCLTAQWPKAHLLHTAVRMRVKFQDCLHYEKVPLQGVFAAVVMRSFQESLPLVIVVYLYSVVLGIQRRVLIIIIFISGSSIEV